MYWNFSAASSGQYCFFGPIIQFHFVWRARNSSSYPLIPKQKLRLWLSSSYSSQRLSSNLSSSRWVLCWNRRHFVYSFTKQYYWHSHCLPLLSFLLFFYQRVSLKNEKKNEKTWWYSTHHVFLSLNHLQHHFLYFPKKYKIEILFDLCNNCKPRDLTTTCLPYE